MIRQCFGSIPALAVLVSLSLVGMVLSASEIPVTTFEDELNADGDCSLREAIQAANTDTACDACVAGNGADTILLSVGTYTLSLTGASEDANVTGDLDIGSEVTLSGAGMADTVIDGVQLDRVFHVLPGPRFRSKT